MTKFILALIVAIVVTIIADAPVRGIIPCSTDTECAELNGGNGDPE